MRSFLRRVAGTTGAVLSCSFVLAACGGGGGSTAVPAATPTPAPLTTRSAARSDAQAALAAVQTFRYAGGSTTIFGATRRALDLRRQHSVGGREPQSALWCAADARGGSTTYTSVTDAAGNTVDTYSAFYDTACKQPELVEVLTYPAASSVTSGSATATVTSYDRNGAVNGYATVLIAVSTSGSTVTITLRVSAATAIGGTPFAQLGLTCTSSLTATSSACGFADVSTAGTPSGVALSLTRTVTGFDPANVSETFSASTYVGGGLGIAQGAGTVWNVTGGQTSTTLNGTLTATVGASTGTAGTIALSDTTTGATLQGTIGVAGLTMTVSLNGTTAATIVLDSNGNGTIRYADGSTETVVGYIIAG